MANTIMTACTLSVLVVALDYIDSNVPNGLAYWVDLYLPF